MVQYSYDAYGVTTTNYGNQLNNPYQYNAEYTDSSTGNQYLRARYYDASNGRFLTKDTYLGETNDPLSRNLYTYARNNPTNLIDPSGHLFGTIIFAIVATVTVVATAVSTYKSVKTHNEQSGQIRDQQKVLEKSATVESVDKYDLNRLQTGNGIYQHYNKRENKVVTFTNAAAYYEYKKLCDELDKLDQNLAINIVHNTLDVLGVIPGYGEVADAANGLIYLAEGDYLNAGLSFISCIPVAGDAAGKGGKAANKTLDVASDIAKHGDNIVDTATDIVKHSDDIADAATDIVKHVDPPKAKPDYDSILQDFADKADDIINNDPIKSTKSSTVQGTYKHSELETMINDLGDSHLQSEVSYAKGSSLSTPDGKVPRGTKDSVRLDAVEFDDKGLITNIWDYKTGNAKFPDSRKQKILDTIDDNLLAPGFSIDNIHMLTPTK